MANSCYCTTLFYVINFNSGIDKNAKLCCFQMHKITGSEEIIPLWIKNKINQTI